MASGIEMAKTSSAPTSAVHTAAWMPARNDRSTAAATAEAAKKITKGANMTQIIGPTYVLMVKRDVTKNPRPSAKPAPTPSPRARRLVVSPCGGVSATHRHPDNKTAKTTA